MTKIFNLRNTVIFVSISVLWKIFLSAALNLHSDEAYYWLWSKDLQPGYYDHSPMVAYFIKLTTLFSDSELAVRFSSIIATVIVSVFLWKLVMKLFNNEQTASASVILVHSMPMMFSASIIITPDTPSFLFLSIATFYVWSLIETENPGYWYLIGLFFGLSLLSKYTAVLFAMSLFLYILFTKKISWFKQYRMYAALLISFICFLPVLYWNYTNGWVSFSYQFSHGLSNAGYRFNYLFEYIGTQMAIFNIIAFLPAFFISFAYLFSKDKKKVFLASFSLPVILFYAVTALKKLPGANWPIPAYFTFSIIAAAYFIEGGKLRHKLLAAGICFNIILSVLIGLHAKYTILPLEKISDKTAVADATNYFHGYKELAERLLKENVGFAVSPAHQVAASIAYYSKNKIKTWAYSNHTKKSQYDIWGFPEESQHQTGAFVYEPGDNGEEPYDIKMLFSNVSDEVLEQKTVRNNNVVRKYNIRKVSGKI